MKYKCLSFWNAGIFSIFFFVHDTLKIAITKPNLGSQGIQHSTLFFICFIQIVQVIHLVPAGTPTHAGLWAERCCQVTPDLLCGFISFMKLYVSTTATNLASVFKMQSYPGTTAYHCQHYQQANLVGYTHSNHKRAANIVLTKKTYISFNYNLLICITIL